jgi:hypothetical protein
VRFTPDRTGTWNYTVSFRTGDDVAMSLQSEAGQPAHFDGASGSFEISESGASAESFRSKGFLQYVGERYLRFQNGDPFLKGGADSPENFLAYEDFDGTVDGDGLTAEGEQPREGEATASSDDADTFLHAYQPHVEDWSEGDPTWQDGRGKGIIGALNYLADQEMNSVYFLTMNVVGDGNDVWPWTAHGERDRFDVSKLDQWNVVFDHMQDRGIMMHVLTQETENDTNATPVPHRDPDEVDAQLGAPRKLDEENPDRDRCPDRLTIEEIQVRRRCNADGSQAEQDAHQTHLADRQPGHGFCSPDIQGDAQHERQAEADGGQRPGETCLPERPVVEGRRARRGSDE